MFSNNQKKKEKKKGRSDGEGSVVGVAFKEQNFGAPETKQKLKNWNTRAAPPNKKEKGSSGTAHPLLKLT